jgi:GDP-D-mannose dehydratase
MTNLIIGSQGQDGQILKDLLSRNNQIVLELNKTGIFVRGSIILKSEKFCISSFTKLFKEHKIKNVFFFAADSKPKTTRIKNYESGIYDIHSNQIFQMLELVVKAIDLSRIEVKFFFASSSLVFAGSSESPQSESTRVAPLERYAEDKIYMQNYLENWEKESKNIELFIGIYYNHESTYRKQGFFTREIIEKALLNFENPKLNVPIELLNPMSVIDMSHAKDFMHNTINLLESGRPGKYIFSSFNGVTAFQFAFEVLEYLNLDPNQYLRWDTKKIHFQEKLSLIGNNSKLIGVLGTHFILSSKRLSHRLTQEWMTKRVFQ